MTYRTVFNFDWLILMRRDLSFQKRVLFLIHSFCRKLGFEEFVDQSVSFPNYYRNCQILHCIVSFHFLNFFFVWKSEKQGGFTLCFPHTVIIKSSCSLFYLPKFNGKSKVSSSSGNYVAALCHSNINQNFIVNVGLYILLSNPVLFHSILTKMEIIF